MDAFYNVLSEEQHELATQNEYNFDRPEAFDFELLIDTLRRLKEYREVKVPSNFEFCKKILQMIHSYIVCFSISVYNFVTHRREERTIPMYGANVIIFEGIFAFHNEQGIEFWLFINLEPKRKSNKNILFPVRNMMDMKIFVVSFFSRKL